MAFDKLRWWITRAIWRVRKKRDERKQPTDTQAAQIAAYYETAMNIFGQLGIDVQSMPIDKRRLYFMTLLFLDNEEVICPAAARTASLIGFLDTTNSGWALPPTSEPVTAEFAKEVDGYFAMECFRNYLGLEDIRVELTNAINQRAAQVRQMPIDPSA